jgi:hypothetical protein
MSYLKFDDIKVGDIIDWHEDFQHNYSARHPEKCVLTEEWKDHIGPLTIIHVSKMSGMKGEKIGFVGYKCSKPNCRICTDKSLTLQGHHKLIKLNGLDTYGRVEFRETKKRIIVEIKNQPVFRKI